ncbi:terpenoid cyclases/Protein prenyltransferase [Xylariomycetidae sp. FL0641]|nr:terpenoid cyclases/Protein prenyltransferase [Xylariomycetidae sp. FL0641]
MAGDDPPDLQPPLDTARHIKYWQRCFRSILPDMYTGNDSSRLLLGFFIIAGLDLLSASSPDSHLLSATDRQSLRDWILSLQHPLGGFCGSPNHVLPGDKAIRWDQASEKYVACDPANANIAPTYFALMSLGVLADENTHNAFQGISRKPTLRWLKKLQREDGSFGEVVTKDGSIAGGRDMRYCYFAASIRWILFAGPERDGSDDIDVDKLVAYIRQAQTFDGGLSESSTHESHSGYAYCGVAALAFLDLANRDPEKGPNHYLRAGIPSIPSLIHFLVNRQILYLDANPDDSENDKDPDDNSANHPILDPSDPVLAQNLSDACIGFNGRLNKLPDTCYAWWVSGALDILGERALIDRGPARRFLLDKTQHLIGGFAKYPGGPPDVYHSYMGLAALATMAGDGDGDGEPGLPRFDPRLCVRQSAAEHIDRGRAALLRDEDARAAAAAADDLDAPASDDDDETWAAYRRQKAEWETEYAESRAQAARDKAAGKPLWNDQELLRLIQNMPC